MASRVLRVRNSAEGALREGIARIQEELHVDPAFAPEVEQAATAAAAAPRLPELDRTDLELVTIDPVGSMDLDQAMHLERDGDGYVVHYAIADLAAFITAGDPVDVEANRRGETLYGADTTVPLHPTALSEGAASLLPGQVRPAFLWTLKVDRHGELGDARVERARVTSRARLDYEGVQQQLDDGSAGETLQLLREVGQLRVAQEIDRGGVNLPMPEQEVDIEGDVWKLEFRTVLPVESWNAQISLLTGFAAASMMINGRVGVLRTLPPPEHDAVKRLHRTAKALKIDWPAEQHYPDFIRGLDSSRPNEAAMVVACTALLRGAGYVGFDGELPAQPEHAALASEYAHVTAPLRRLVDRYALEVCAALTAGEQVPQWVLDRLHDLPATMQESGRRAHQYEAAVLDLVEAETLKGRVGEPFEGVVLEVEHDELTKGDLMVRDPAVEARVVGREALPVGEAVTVTLAEADPATRTVRFQL
ncbi:RNB domain-containing ribonuclease [Nocardioides terrisoli]|uniref:RNB domain-containing ribonuclease n=1 Tax=Nocardioides terrisoli TaxID=3388267 RepID=UPI00287B605F|nr:RNB domain-containing ribonuclease [Nocardioides marmorisolisilvae]